MSLAQYQAVPITLSQLRCLQEVSFDLSNLKIADGYQLTELQSLKNFAESEL